MCGCGLNYLLNGKKGHRKHIRTSASKFGQSFK